MKSYCYILTSLMILPFMFACESTISEKSEEKESTLSIREKVDEYAPFKLTTDLSKLTENEKQMLVLMIQASAIMDDLYKEQAYGDLDKLLNELQDVDIREYAAMNYGPWDRLRNNESFVDGIGDKPDGANFYPADMSKEEFAEAEIADKESLYTYLRRNESGDLYTVPFHKQYEAELTKASSYLKEAAELAEDEGLRKYLLLRADALLNDDYRESDLVWMDMRDNTLDLIIGPIETYEDQLYGFKASYEAYVLVKDIEWSERLTRYAAFLPVLQENLPVDEAYKQEKPGTDADLGAYDAIYFSGAANSGGKTIAKNLPNDEEVQLKKGTRRLQLENAMRAKFDKILMPIVDVLITPEQRGHVNFDAFFANTMFHEVAHGLGIKNTLDGKGTVRRALKEHASALEEGKADILGLYMVEQLLGMGEMEGNIEDYYVTFIAGIFRSVRFGASSAHGVANMIRFNYFRGKGAFERQEDGTYKVNFDKMHGAVESLSRLILTLQGDGDYAGVDKLVNEMGKIGTQLQADLDRIEEARIPIDIRFEQGIKALGL